MKWIVGTAFVVVLCGGAWVFWKRHPLPPRASNAAEAIPLDREADMQGAVDQLRREVNGLRLSQASIAAAVSSREETPAMKDAKAGAAAASEDHDPERMMMEAQAQQRARVKAIEDGYANEKPDPTWSAAAQKQLVAAYDGARFSGVHIEAVCKSSLCRLNIALDAHELAANGAAQLIANASPWPNRGYMRIDSETGRGVFYITREGYDLPQGPQIQ